MDSFDQGEILGQFIGFALFFFLLGGCIALARQAPRALPSTLRQILSRLKEFMRRSDVFGRIKQFDVTPFVRDPQGAIQDLYVGAKRQLGRREDDLGEGKVHLSEKFTEADLRPLSPSHRRQLALRRSEIV